MFDQDRFLGTLRERLSQRSAVTSREVRGIRNADDRFLEASDHCESGLVPMPERSGGWDFLPRSGLSAKTTKWTITTDVFVSWTVTKSCPG